MQASARRRALSETCRRGRDRRSLPANMKPRSSRKAALSKPPDERVEIVGPLGFERELLAAHRMFEFQSGRVEHLSRRAEFRPARTVRRIANDRMADRGHVDADLMRASGLELQLEQRSLHIARPEALADPIVSHRATALRPNGE